ncbi:MAG: hypothetical protein ABIS92_14965 [Polyangia bacterium]
MTTKVNLKLIALALGSVLMTGCYTTRIVSGAPPQSVAPLAQERWHHTVVVGMAEVSPPVDLEANCPGRAWSEIKEESTFPNGVVSSVTSSLYTPRTYTVTCGAAMASAPAPSPPAVGR